MKTKMKTIVVRIGLVASLAFTFVSEAAAVGFEQLMSFNFSNGSSPYSSKLVQGSDGNFYGTTSKGGANDGMVGGNGTVFKMTPAGALTTLVSFNYSNGRSPNAGLVQGSDGNFYGTTYLGGSKGYGTVFKMTPKGTLTTLVSFNYSNGRYPSAELVQGGDGNFYGTTASGGTNHYGGVSDDGTVFKMTPTGTLTTLVSFNGFNGRLPSGLVRGRDGNFYGTTYQGGAIGYDYGTVFKITPTGSLTTLVSFDFKSYPQAGLVQGSDGNFYGTTSSGYSYGTVFKMTPTGTLTTLVSFNSSNGRYPGALMQGSDGNFYGTTLSGGGKDYGVVFKMTPTGTLTTLVSFNYSNGSYPGGLVQGNDGNFYGTTSMGGASGNGTVYRWVTGFGPPSAPAGLIATALAPGFASLSWRKTSTNVSGFTISRSMVSGGPYYSLINVSATTTNYQDRTVHSGLTYYYVVKAYNNGGSSANSAQASVTLPIGLTDNLIFQNTNGAFSLWVMDQTNFVRYGSITNGLAPKYGWRIAAFPDLNSDNNADILWQNSDGRIWTWLMRGTNFLRSAQLRTGPKASTGWKIVSAPDLTGDGKPDFLWHHTKGTNMYWKMNGTNFVAQYNLRMGSGTNTGWNMIGTADLDGNLSADFIWNNTGGWNSVWLMNRTNYIKSIPLRTGSNALSGWKISAFMDVNADRKTDFIWEKNDGRLQAWLMNGTNYLRSVTLKTNAAASTGWKLVGPK